jgi:hypothetical protein
LQKRINPESQPDLNMAGSLGQHPDGMNTSRVLHESSFNDDVKNDKVMPRFKSNVRGAMKSVK